MGGDKTSSRTSDQHNDNNMINFVVPDWIILQKQIDLVNINCENQGVLEQNVENLAQ